MRRAAGIKGKLSWCTSAWDIFCTMVWRWSHEEIKGQLSWSCEHQTIPLNYSRQTQTMWLNQTFSTYDATASTNSEFLKLRTVFLFGGGGRQISKISTPSVSKCVNSWFLKENPVHVMALELLYCGNERWEILCGRRRAGIFMEFHGIPQTGSSATRWHQRQKTECDTYGQTLRRCSKRHLNVQPLRKLICYS